MSRSSGATTTLPVHARDLHDPFALPDNPCHPGLPDPGSPAGKTCSGLRHAHLLQAIRAPPNAAGTTPAYTGPPAARGAWASGPVNQVTARPVLLPQRLYSGNVCS